MKDKIIIFVIGVLVGAVISTGAFFIYNSCNCGNKKGQIPPQMQNNNQPPMNNNSNNNQPPMNNNDNSNNNQPPTQNNNE